MPRLVLIAALLLLPLPAGPAHAQPSTSFGNRPDGTPVRSLAPTSAKAAVLFFVASDCPISNRTFPEMKRLREQFTAQGIRFWFVYPNASEPPATVAAHQSAFDPAGEAILDTGGTLTGLAHATTTPEAAVLTLSNGAWKPVYTGRIDDRFVHFGVERPQATEHFAERVLREVLEARPVEPATGTPVGCSIVAKRIVPSRLASSLPREAK